METARGKKRKVTARDVIRFLGREYALAPRRPRYDPIDELVLTILSQHTSDVNAERVFLKLKGLFSSWDAVASTEVQEIAQAIKGGGLAQQKAPRIKGALSRIKELRGELALTFLRDMSLADAKAWLRRLPGVGPKTAAVVLCFSLGMPAMPVDTHVYRVTRRLGLVDAKVKVDEAHDVLEGLVKPRDVYAFHVYLITHGRRVCKAQNPLCGGCVLAWGCPSARL